MGCEAFRKAVETEGLDGAVSQIAEGCVLHSPVTFKPFVGREAVRGLFSILVRVFEDFRYEGEFHAPDGSGVLHFRTRVGDRDVEGIDMLRFDADGLIEDFTVMVPPLSAVTALRDAIGSQLGGAPQG